MPRKLKPKAPDNEEQSRRFIETAQSLQVERTGKAFKLAMDTIAPRRHKPGAPDPKK